MGVGIERDVGDRVAIGDEEGPLREVALHHSECGLAPLALLGEPLAVPGRQLRVPEPEARGRHAGLVAVLLEEHPLERLRASDRLLGQERRALGQVEQDGARLG